MQIAWGHRGPKRMEYLAWFTSCPVASAYVSIILLTWRACCGVALKNKRVSSTNSKCDTPGARRHTLTGSTKFESISFFNKVEKPSATKRNKNGERGSPCRSPRDGANDSSRVPLSLTLYLTEVTHCIIHFTQRWAKPNFSITFSKKAQSTRSYAFERSSLYAQKLFSGSFSYWMWWMHSKESIALSVISCPGINALWASEITSSNMGLNLFTKHLETTLYITLQRLIGLNCSNFLAHPPSESR
jgi:hypothetical protein